MIEFEKLFYPDTGYFTVFVVEQRFVVGQGHSYFSKYINTPNFFDSEEKAKTLYDKIIKRIESSLNPISNLISKIICGNYLSSITDIVSALCKLFSVTEHQAAGPDVIDPIIIQEGKVTKRLLTKIINIHRESILRPSIIILLKDNDFERAKDLLSECPDGINVKMIRNSGEISVYKVINCGADDISSFITSFSEQCYSTCANTKIEVLLNSDWVDNPVISSFSPLLFHYRTNLLLDKKDIVKSNLSQTIVEIKRFHAQSERDIFVLKTIECVAKLYRVFCNDYGGQDLLDAHALAKSLENSILLAQVYECADLLPECSLSEKLDLYDKGYSIFKKHNMEDHAIYCKNNKLIEQFYSDKIDVSEFNDLYVEAISNVPGMVGLTHICNNVGVAFLYCGMPQEAIHAFDQGLEYANSQQRILQRLALESNKMIAECYAFNIIDENRIRLLVRQIFDGLGLNNLPFLAADFLLNVLSVSFKQNPILGEELIATFPVKELINKAFNVNGLSAAERLMQMQYLETNYPGRFTLLHSCSIPKISNLARGKRKEFIIRYGLSPFDFSTWM